MKRLTSVCLILLLLLAGCGSKSTMEETTETAAQTQKSPNPVKKTNEDTLTIAMPSGVSNYNPLLVNNSDMVNLLWLSYDSLFKVNQEGKLEPNLVESYKVENGVYTFTLRKDVKWHNGKSLTANDVKYTVDQIKAGERASDQSQARNTLYSNVRSIVKEMSVTDGQTFTMTLDGTGISPLYALVFPVVCSDGTETGTGAYRAVEKNSEGIRYEVNTESWRKQPNIKRIQAIAFSDDEAANKAYQENKVDVIFASHDTIGLFQYNKNTKTMNARTNNYYYLLPNLRNGKMSNLKFRQALCYGLDKDSLVSRTFDNGAIVSDYPIPTDYYIFDSELQSYTSDFGKCIRLFADNGYTQVKEGSNTYLKKNSETFTLKVVGLKNLYHQNLAATLQSQLSEIGIRVNIELFSAEDYRKALSNGSYDLAIANTTISSEFDLRFMLGSGGGLNLNSIRSSTIDQALSAIAGEAEDMVKIKDGYMALQKELLKTLPQIGLCFTTDTLIYNDRVSGIYRVANNDLLADIYHWSFEETATTQTQTQVD